MPRRDSPCPLNSDRQTEPGRGVQQAHTGEASRSHFGLGERLPARRSGRGAGRGERGDYLGQLRAADRGGTKQKRGHRSSALFYASLARLAGFEPTTPWFVAKYSIQLSYRREGRIIAEARAALLPGMGLPRGGILRSG